MKTICIAFLCLMIALTVEANTANPEEMEVQNQSNIEVGEMIDDMFKIETGLVQNETTEIKIVILNSDFRKVREDNIKSMDEINKQSTLVPVIYWSEFVTKIYSVSYYILKD